MPLPHEASTSASASASRIHQKSRVGPHAPPPPASTRPDWVLDAQLAQQLQPQSSLLAANDSRQLPPRVILVLTGAGAGAQQPSERCLRSLLFSESLRHCLVIFQQVIPARPTTHVRRESSSTKTRSRMTGNAKTEDSRSDETEASMLSRERTVKASDVHHRRRPDSTTANSESTSSTSSAVMSSGWHLPASAAQYVQEYTASFSDSSSSPPRIQPTAYTCTITCRPSKAETTKAFVEQAVAVAIQWKKKQHRRPTYDSRMRPQSSSASSFSSTYSSPPSPSLSPITPTSAAQGRPQNRRGGSSWYQSASGFGRRYESDEDNGSIREDDPLRTTFTTPPKPQSKRASSSSWSLSSASSVSSSQSRSSQNNRGSDTSTSVSNYVLDGVINLLPPASCVPGPQRFQSLLKDTLFTTTLVLPYLSRPTSALDVAADDEVAAIPRRATLIHVLPSDAPEPLPAVLESYLTSLKASPDVHIAAYAVASRVVDSPMPPAFDRIGRNALEILLGGGLAVTNGAGIAGRAGSARPSGGDKAYLASWSACRFTSFPPPLDRPPAVVMAPSAHPTASSSSSAASLKKDRPGSQGSVAMESVASSSTTSRSSWTASSDTELSGPPTPPSEVHGSPPKILKPDLQTYGDPLPRIGDLSIVGPPKVVKSRQSWIGKLFK